MLGTFEDLRGTWFGEEIDMTTGAIMCVLLAHLGGLTPAEFTKVAADLGVSVWTLADAIASGSGLDFANTITIPGQSK